jgi:hypothetical protein
LANAAEGPIGSANPSRPSSGLAGLLTGLGLTGSRFYTIGAILILAIGFLLQTLACRILYEPVTVLVTELALVILDATPPVLGLA